MEAKELRCPNCQTNSRPGQLLLRAQFVKGEIKCPRCGALLRLEYPKDRADGRIQVIG